MVIMVMTARVDNGIFWGNVATINLVIRMVIPITIAVALASNWVWSEIGDNIQL